VFPWETLEETVEGDRGLFRNQTDNYGKAALMRGM